MVVALCFLLSAIGKRKREMNKWIKQTMEAVYQKQLPSIIYFLIFMTGQRRGTYTHYIANGREREKKLHRKFHRTFKLKHFFLCVMTSNVCSRAKSVNNRTVFDLRATIPPCALYMICVHNWILFIWLEIAFNLIDAGDVDARVCARASFINKYWPYQQ